MNKNRNERFKAEIKAVTNSGISVNKYLEETSLERNYKINPSALELANLKLPYYKNTQSSQPSAPYPEMVNPKSNNNLPSYKNTQSSQPSAPK